MRVVPPPYHSRGYSHQEKYSNGIPCPQITFFSVLAFLCQTQQSLKSVLRFTSQLLFKNFPGGRIGEWTEARSEEKETDFDNSCAAFYKLTSLSEKER